MSSADQLYYVNTAVHFLLFFRLHVLIIEKIVSLPDSGVVSDGVQDLLKEMFSLE